MPKPCWGIHKIPSTTNLRSTCQISKSKVTKIHKRFRNNCHVFKTGKTYFMFFLIRNTILWWLLTNLKNICVLICTMWKLLKRFKNNEQNLMMMFAINFLTNFLCAQMQIRYPTTVHIIVIKFRSIKLQIKKIYNEKIKSSIVRLHFIIQI